MGKRDLKNWLMINSSFIPSFGMEAPRVDGLNVLSLIGYGECGRVYLARDDEGRQVAVKLFEAMAIHRTLLAKMTDRLENGGWPDGVMPVYSADFEGRPSLWVTPLHSDDRGEGEAVPRTLQRRLPEHPGEQSWPLVRKIAARIIRMRHRRSGRSAKPGRKRPADIARTWLKKRKFRAAWLHSAFAAASTSSA